MHESKNVQQLLRAALKRNFRAREIFDATAILHQIETRRKFELEMVENTVLIEEALEMLTGSSD